MNRESQEKHDGFEPAPERLRRIDLTFQLAPAWEHLKNSPVGEFETPDLAPLTPVALNLPMTTRQGTAEEPTN